MPIVLLPNRQGFSVKTLRLALARGVLTKESLVSFTYNRGRFSERLGTKMLAGLLKQGGQIGFRLRRGQRIKHLEVAGMKLTPSAKVSRGLVQTFGAAPDERWVGFPILGRALLLRGGFKTRLRVTFRPRTRAAFQLVPVVIAFGGQDLSRHFVLGVSVLTRGRPRVDSFVEVVSGR